MLRQHAGTAKKKATTSKTALQSHPKNAIPAERKVTLPSSADKTIQTMSLKYHRQEAVAIIRMEVQETTGIQAVTMVPLEMTMEVAGMQEMIMEVAGIQETILEPIREVTVVAGNHHKMYKVKSN